jgi:hypothetical protein
VQVSFHRDDRGPSAAVTSKDVTKSAGDVSIVNAAVVRGRPAARRRPRAARHVACVPPSAMRVLEARFHPQHDGVSDFIVVAHVVWEGDERGEPPSVQPSATLVGTGAATMLIKLQFLVARAAPETFARLQSLKSQFWSFVDVTPRRH